MQIIIHGSNSHFYHEASQFTGKKWGIKVISYEICSIDQNVSDSIASINEKTWHTLDSIYGIKSKEKFGREVIVEMKKIAKANEILEADADINKMVKEIEKTDKKVVLYLQEISDDGSTYIWRFYSYNVNEIKWNYEFEVSINPSDGNIEIKNYI